MVYVKTAAIVGAHNDIECNDTAKIKKSLPGLLPPGRDNIECHPLVLIGAVEGNIEAIFEDGYNSIWKIAVFFLLVASVYPKLGFISRIVPVEARWNSVRETVVDYMSEQRYVIESESPEKVTFRFKTVSGRIRSSA